MERHTSSGPSSGAFGTDTEYHGSKRMVYDTWLRIVPSKPGEESKLHDMHQPKLTHYWFA